MTILDCICETCMRRIGLIGGSEDCPLSIPSHCDTAEAYTIEKVGCISHSSARYELMKPIIAEMEQQKALVSDCVGDDSIETYCDTIDEIIDLIKTWKD